MHAPSPLVIAQGYRPGIIGRITEMHAEYYSREAGFGQFFESRVASGLAEFAGRLDKPCNGIWSALDNGRVVGSIAIDGEDLDNNEAHLRWFIMDDGLRGQGTGRALISAAVAFCDRNKFAKTRLWTYKSLDAARKLYEDHGFVLEEEFSGTQWGKEVMEQVFSRPARAIVF